MRLNAILGQLTVLLGLYSAEAIASPVRLNFNLGFGATNSSNEVSESEGPMVQQYSAEYILDTKNVAGVEHTRSFNPSSIQTSVAFSGISYRYYLNSVPGPYTNLQNQPENTFQVRDLCYYLGASGGVAQSSFPPNLDDKVASAAGFYVNPKAGMELALSPRFAFRSEFNFATTVVGTGTITSVSLSAGVLYGF